MKVLLPLAITALIVVFMCKFSPPSKREEKYCPVCMM